MTETDKKREKSFVWFSRILRPDFKANEENELKAFLIINSFYYPKESGPSDNSHILVLDIYGNEKWYDVSKFKLFAASLKKEFDEWLNIRRYVQVVPFHDYLTNSIVYKSLYSGEVLNADPFQIDYDEFLNQSQVFHDKLKQLAS